MGYDSNECIKCYCQHGGNNCSNIIQMTICNDCFMKQCPRGLRGRACCSSYVRISKARCDVCDNYNVPCLTNVAICLECVEDFDPKCDISERHVFNPDEEDEPHEYDSLEDTLCPYDRTLECDGSCGCINCSACKCDGSCGCINCSAWQDRAVELFTPSQ